jgi:hypothetical protein
MVRGLREDTELELFRRHKPTWISKVIGWEGVDGINLAQNREESQ